MSNDTAITELSHSTLRLFATAARGLEPLLADELRALGAAGVKESRAGCAFAGTLETAYRVCLWSRMASRVLLPLAEVGARDADDLYEGVRSLAWEAHLVSTGTLAVDFTASGSSITHTHYGALRVKDAIVDRFRDLTGVRPSVDVHRPDLRIYAHTTADAAVVGLDLSGTALHRRGYRDEGVQGQAPLKENLAAAILVRAGWPEVVAGGGGFLDPMCGSGTLPIEAGLMAGDVAPGLLRRHWGFSGWKQHEAAIWDRLLDEARARRLTGLSHLPPIVGFDADSRAVRLALTGVERAGLRGVVHVERRSFSQIDGPPFAASGPGLVVANPPYGERLGEAASLGPLYAELGRRLREGFLGWKAAVLTADAELARWTGLRSHRKYAFYNGALEVRLFLFELRPDRFAGAYRHVSANAQEVASPPHGSSKLELLPHGSPPSPSPAPPAPPATVQPPGATTHGASEREQSTGAAEIMEDETAGGESVTVRLDRSAAGVEMLSNRLRKNLKHLRSWVRREGVTCYRLYDADLPEYAVAIDVYERWVHVQEYEPPPTVDLARAQARLRDVLDAIAGVLQVPSQDVFLKVRRRQRGASQYEAQAAGSAVFHEVGESGLRFLVDFEKRLDTGLFLDHRQTRALIRSAAEEGRFLNLFAYTGTATVFAAAGGARETTSVDLSGRYLDWAGRNLALNGFEAGPIERWNRPVRQPNPDRWAPPARSRDSKPHRHRLVQADCLEWLQCEQGTYDLAFLDPPTFSNSKRMGDAVLDIQRDHVELIQRTVRLLAPGGTLLFSTNNRRFRMDRDALDGLELEDLSAKTLPPDFARNPRVHSCWRIRAGVGD